MGKQVKKASMGAAVLLALTLMLPISGHAAEEPEDLSEQMIAEDRDLFEERMIAEDRELIYSIPGLDIYRTTVVEEAREQYFTTSFFLRFLDESKKYDDGTAAITRGGAGRAGGGNRRFGGDDGIEIGESGISFEPPMIAALAFGAGYFLCAGVRSAVIRGYGRKGKRENA